MTDHPEFTIAALRYISMGLTGASILFAYVLFDMWRIFKRSGEFQRPAPAIAFCLLVSVCAATTYTFGRIAWTGDVPCPPDVRCQ